MRINTFLKGALAGGVGATAVLGATAAFAGSGIGGVFNLGQVNTVDATSTLTGAKANGAELQVTNTSATGPATGLSVTTAAGKPPLTVSNNVMNPRLNAQFLGGFAANGLGRVAMASSHDFDGGFSFSSLLTVSITAPAKGFVRLEGRVGVFDGSAASYCTDCEVAVELRDVSTGTTSPMSLTVGGAGTHSTYLEIPTTWVFPVTSGAHSYSLDTGQVDFAGGPFALHNPVLVAQYVPFGATGSQSSLSRASEGAR